jgi:hypothetical protein
MNLSNAAKKKLGTLVDEADKTVAELILKRGGKASNIRQTGHWANRTLEEAADAAARGDRTAETAIKIVKQAKRLGEKH